MLRCGHPKKTKDRTMTPAGCLEGASEHATKRYNGLQEDGASFSQKGQAYCSEEAQAYCCGERQAYCCEEDDAALADQVHADFSEETQPDFRRRDAGGDLCTAHRTSGSARPTDRDCRGLGCHQLLARRPCASEELMRLEEHTSELQSHSFISYAVFCLKK